MCACKELWDVRDVVYQINGGKKGVLKMVFQVDKNNIAF